MKFLAAIASAAAALFLAANEVACQAGNPFQQVPVQKCVQLMKSANIVKRRLLKFTKSVWDTSTSAPATTSTELSKLSNLILSISMLVLKISVSFTAIHLLRLILSLLNVVPRRIKTWQQLVSNVIHAALNRYIS